MSSITIRHLRNSTLAGQSRDFSATKVRLGRRPDNDVIFDAVRDALVSGAHVEVRLESGSIVVEDLGSSNGTFVNGQRISGPTTITPRDIVTLGSGGPEFTVATAAPPVAHTVAAPRRPAAQAPEVPSVRPFASPKTPAIPRQARAEAPAEVPIQQVVKAGGGTSQKSPGVNTIMRIVTEATRKERRRTTLIAGILAIFLCVGVGVAVWGLRRPAAEVREVPTQQEVFATISRSTYVVMKEKEVRGRKVYSAEGTAWSVKKGLLATNAHVAAIFATLQPGEVLIARSHTIAGDEPHDLRIVGTKTHPGYKAFSDLVNEVMPFFPSTKSFGDTIPACDVAVLEIADEDQAKQAPPLALYTDEEVEALEPGMKIYSAGFPIEGLTAQDWTRPNASTLSSQVSKINDVFLGQARAPEGHTFSYQFSVVGGQSGSPVTDEYGRVIGLVSAMNVGGFMDRGRVPNPGSYGPRVDLLLELLDGTADEVQQKRNKRWRNRIREVFAQGISNPEPFAVYLSRFVGDQADWKWKGLTYVGDVQAVELKTGEDVTVDFDIPGEGKYVISIIAEDPGARIEANYSDAGGFQSPMRTEYYFAYEGFIYPGASVGHVRLRLSGDSKVDKVGASVICLSLDQ